MRLRKASAFTAAVITLSLAATACGGGDDEGDGDNADGITIGIKFDQPGLGLRDGNNEYSGFDVDVATYIAGELGYEPDQITWREAPSPDRENLLRRGDVDMIVATYSINEEREEQVDFAGPYFLAHQDLLVRADYEVPDVEAINDMTLCSVVGSTSAQNVQEDFAPNARLQEFPTYSECLNGLEGGAIDALTTDDSILAGYAAQEEHQDKFKLAELDLSDEYYGVGLPKDSDRLEDVNAAIEQMVEDGSWAQAVEDNFGPAGYEAEDAPEIGARPTD
ncbi:glutamate ABC transporter substrate-binding protein [Streptomyces litchfieldiae]|uniref:Glutamate ABC transporter substrate-binding protein n=1 Tax=Streptomyces litchfieldiae TaxID=3075543 RepID=A0ABU2N137_9ACTN|nr:glutamate ABC transporter substrate-binding protein [Streptomyces sp. DSM 44938]MDT0347307.1 glutamate ABC transporter substrate-binding protein [Streptomyces sp. DSM 44938]